MMMFECDCGWKVTLGCCIETNKDRSVHYCPDCNKPLTTAETEPVAKLACSDGLVGLTLDDTRCIHKALGLMNSMIFGGEKHTLTSEKVLYEAQQALRKAN